MGKIFCTELVTVDAVEVKQSLCEVHPQVEIPEKLTQEPPCFAITTGVRLRSHTKNFTGFSIPQFRTNFNYNRIVTTFIDLIELVQLILFIDKTVNSWHSYDHEYIHIYKTFLYVRLYTYYRSFLLIRFAPSSMTSSNGNIFRVTGLCEGNPTIKGEFLSQRPVAQSFDAFFDLCLSKRLSKQSRRWWFETQSRSSWCHCNVNKDVNAK